MKVLLFVDGPKGPRCVTTGNAMRIRVNGKWFLSSREAEARRSASRWWLVECENAEAGRVIIARETYPGLRDGAAGNYVKGRILASGGSR